MFAICVEDAQRARDANEVSHAERQVLQGELGTLLKVRHALLQGDSGGLMAGIELPKTIPTSTQPMARAMTLKVAASEHLGQGSSRIASSRIAVATN